ncbi:carboxypeptidase regulatory-like domain-containing protein [uncultured Nonlabens sp.]|uniref:TonB-dependent receptor n=1 Tax=uncultured Nonlabens sp. TaxID=859306 RepID=UPI00260C8D91|nr:carboxypeptidase regulatory-like domain-containing protein [uncultured Nonlabens sp.]
MNRTLKFLFAIGLLLSTMAVNAQVTTSSINGRIMENVDNSQEPLLGATIVAVHGPTGTNYGTSTDIEGFYRIANMRVGGPYTITISYVSKKVEKLENIYLQLGESEKISLTLVDESNALDAVVINAVRDGVFDSGKTGTTTNISTREINTMPSVTRGIGDFLRKTPQAQVTEGGAISIGGQNNRYNSIFIDGAVNNDVFGLSGSGTNGGQIGVNPISIDAIESFQVNIAPFDVRQSGFTGGAINAITRSGTNEFKGSAYFYTRNEKLAGKTPQAIVDQIDRNNGTDPAPDRERLDEFTANLYGARLGGPIIKNKLFFFVNAEIQREETPRTFDPNLYSGDTSIADLQQFRQNLINTFGYDPGSFGNTIRELNSEKFTVKLDYNVDDKNTLTFKHNYVNGESISPGGSGSRSINFSNSGIFFPSTTNFSTLEWNTSNGSNLSNNLILSYTTVRDDRDPIGNPFPRVSIGDGNGNITLGSEAFSTGNILDQDVFTVTNNFEINKGAHNITLGGNFEHYDMRNVFVRQNFGQYTFNTLAEFNTYFDNDATNDAAADSYDYSYSLLDPLGTSGDDIVNAAAAFGYSQLGLYAQDQWDITDNFKLTYGVRFDVPFFEDGLANEDFNTRTVDLLEAAGRDLRGARVGKAIKSQIHVAPRAGFNWDVNGDNTTQIRGGLGIFTSRIPLVWPGGAYNNNGLSVGGVDERNFVDGAFFVADPNNQPIGDGAAPGSGQLGGQIDIFDPNFRLPQVMKYNIGIDQKTNVWGLIASADFLYNDNINNVTYQNLNIEGEIGRLNGADNRPYFSRRTIDRTYRGVYLGTNTNEGWSYNASFSLTKPYENGFSGQVSYTYGQGKSIFEGTSSQNSSQWRNVVTVNGKNNAAIGNSAFALGHRISANASYELKWNNNFKTTFGVFYNGQQGGTLSYTYNDFRASDLLGDDSRDNALIYIPRDASEINLIDDGSVTAAEQWAALDAFIEGNDYLRERRGEYAERNGDRGPWNHIVDFKVLQDFSLDFGGKKHTFQASVDIFNFFNFLNKDWGRQERINNRFGSVQLLTTERGGPDPEFTFDTDFAEDFKGFDDAGTRSSRWQMQVGLRYIFN